MIFITPQQFKSAFVQVVSAFKSALMQRWEIPVDGIDYTYFMQYSVLPDLGRELGLSYRPEYKKIDGVYFAEDFPRGSMNPTSLSVALEHENDIRSSFNEVNALQLYNCPLKVLVTYTPGGPEHPLHESKNVRDAYLKEYLHIVQKADIFRDFHKTRRLLIIIGCLRNDDVEWHFYSYEEHGFSEI